MHSTSVSAHGSNSRSLYPSLHSLIWVATAGGDPHLSIWMLFKFYELGIAVSITPIDDAALQAKSANFPE